MAIFRALVPVAQGVWVATSQTWTSLTTIITRDGEDGACLVVDPGITVPEVDSLAGEISARGWHVEAAFSTHPHWDHVLWSASLGNAPRWATSAAVASQERTRDSDLLAAEADAPGHDTDLVARLTPLPDDLAALPWSGPRALVVRHRAHARGHAALVFPELGVLVAGDMLSDLEIPLLDLEAADPIGDYRAALDTLEVAVTTAAVRTVVPGHGHVGDAGELARRFAADRAYLDALDADREPDDARLSTAWLAAEHARHRDARRRDAPRR